MCVIRATTLPCINGLARTTCMQSLDGAPLKPTIKPITTLYRTSTTVLSTQQTLLRKAIFSVDSVTTLSWSRLKLRMAHKSCIQFTRLLRAHYTSLPTLRP